MQMSQDKSFRITFWKHRLNCPPNTLQILAETRVNVTREEHNAPAPRVSIDAENRLLVDSKPTLPLGIYFQVYDINATTMALLQASPIQIIMPYGDISVQELDMAHAYGIRVIVALDSYAPGSLASEWLIY